ncbi:hypothetical protein H257_00071 [Aphanomyces astaci]|uniref:Uncharacterized protein n=1 Tax=Aphanomyces astaci TaxID=112090 RepID=W4H969_APHAT|nr:hypothetical protein H257_00071 [Aphanomyces astaci]ETV88487.1 hypothetical protein H257_00071 [Aphanomyces astaci]|eukprot:XP_009820887.1 hypothetical protein H257_00071 [Aphanomyces astaci]
MFDKCRTNSVLSALHLPNCITALPLDPSNGIKMGNKMYCKPSTIAIMGYTTVVKCQCSLCRPRGHSLPNGAVGGRIAPSTISVVAESKTVDITLWKGVWSRGSLDTLLTFSKAQRKLETIDWEAFSFFFNDQVAMAELLHRRLSAYEVGPGGPGLSLP